MLRVLERKRNMVEAEVSAHLVNYKASGAELARNGPFISPRPRTEANSVSGTSLDPDHVGIEILDQIVWGEERSRETNS